MNGALDNRSVQFRHGLQIDQFINNLKTLINYGLWLFEALFASVLFFYEYLMNTVGSYQGNPFVCADIIGINKLNLWIFSLFVFKHFRDVFINMIPLK